MEQTLSPREFTRRLLEPLRQGRLALFVGAGLSRGSGLPSWAELFTPLCENHGVEPYDDYPALASHLLEAHRVPRRDLVAAVCQAIAGRELAPNDNHRLLKRLPLNLLLTTNYDLLLEDLYGSSRLTKIASDGAAAYHRPEAGRTTLIYLHGNVDHPDGMVISDGDYQRWHHDHPNLADRLQRVFTDRSVLFLGYSARDRNVNAILDHVKLRAGEAARRHYLLLVGRHHPAELSSLRGRGIEPLPLADPAELTRFLQGLLDACHDPAHLDTLTDTLTDTPADTPAPPPRSAPEPLHLPRHPPLRLPFQPPANLPNRVPHFTGRDAELAQVLEALDASRPLSIAGLMGMGGIGKTALALEVAHRCRAERRFPDGVCWHALMDKELEASLEELAAELGMSGYAAIEEPRERHAAFRRALDGRRLLFVLDDANYPRRIPPLLELLAGQPLLITSRQDLGGLTRGIDLDRLAPEAAGRLYLRTREEAVADDASADAHLRSLPPERRAALDALCRDQLGGLPLAISLAASVAAAQAWPPERLLEELQRRRLDLLRDDPERRVTARDPRDLDVRLSFALSYALLPEDGPERLLFDCSGVFADQGFPAAALAAVAGLEPERAAPALERLRRQHLVIREDDERLRLHPLLREYAVERLAERGAAAPWGRMVKHYVDLLRKEPKALEYEWRNALGAVEWCFERGTAAEGLFLMRRVDDYLYRSGRWGMREARLERAVELAEAAERPEDVFWFRYWHADQRDRQGRVAEGLAAWWGLREWCRRFPGLGEELRWCDYSVAEAERRLGEGDRGLGRDLANLRVCLIVEDWRTASAILHNLGNRYRAWGALNTARACFHAQLLIDQGLDSHGNIPRSHGDLFDLYLDHGEREAAWEQLEAIHLHLQEHPHREDECQLNGQHAWLALARDDPPAARHYLEPFRALAVELGALDWQADADLLEGRIAAREGDPGGAEAALRRALAGYEALRLHGDTLEPLRHLALLLARQGRLPQARPLLERARTLLERHGGPVELARWEAAQALLQAHSGYGREAVRLIRRARNSLAAFGVDDAEERALEAEVRALLGEAQWAETLAGLAREGLEGETVDPRRDEIEPGPLPGELRSPIDGREMVLIPSGPLPAGADPYPGWLPPLYLDRRPVSHRDYARHLADLALPAPPHWPAGAIPPGLEEAPVVGLTLDEARGYAEWAGKLLPLAQEWEAAAGLREGRRRPPPDLEGRRRRLIAAGRHPLTLRAWSGEWEQPLCLALPGGGEEGDGELLAELLLHKGKDEAARRDLLARWPGLGAAEREALRREMADRREEYGKKGEYEKWSVDFTQRRTARALASAAHADVLADSPLLAAELAHAEGEGGPHLAMDTLREWTGSEAKGGDAATKGAGWQSLSPEHWSLEHRGSARADQRIADLGFRCAYPIARLADLDALRDSGPMDEAARADWFARRAAARLEAGGAPDLAAGHCRRALERVADHRHALTLLVRAETARRPDAPLAEWREATLAPWLAGFDRRPPLAEPLDALLAADAALPGTPDKAALEAQLRRTDALLEALDALCPDLPLRLAGRTTEKAQDYALHRWGDRLPIGLLGWMRLGFAYANRLRRRWNALERAERQAAEGSPPSPQGK